MTTPRWLFAAVLAAVFASHAARAEVSSGEPAALLVFPLISVDATTGADTLIELANADDGEIFVRCLYRTVQESAAVVTPFQIRLMANQPVAWQASAGLGAVPGDGGVIPPLGGPFTGALRCVAVDAAGAPVERNALFGSATLEQFSTTPAMTVDSSRYAALGHDALPGRVDGDATLVLGGPAAEYAACPSSLIFQSFFDGAVIDLGVDAAVHRELATTLAVVSCAQSASAGTLSTVNFTVTNEFGQRLTFLRSISDQLVVPISRIDTETPAQSIFHVAQQNSLAGTIRITPQTGSGVLAIAVQTEIDPNDPLRRHAAGVSAQLDGARTDADLLELAAPTPTATPIATPTRTSPPPSCTGDCDGDGAVAINELIAGVNIALGNQPVSSCASFDADHDGQVAINELIAAVNNALGTC
jgi:hypothetical protein